LWQDSSTNTLYEISLPGLYSITVTNECGSYDDQLLVQLNPPPTIDLGTDHVLCSAQFPDTLGVNSTGLTSILWNDGSVNPQLIINSAGTYSVTVTTACGSGTDTIQVAVDDKVPLVELPADLILCEGDSLYLYNTGDPGDPVWQDGSITDSLLVQSTGIYSLAVTTVCGTGYDTVSVGFSPDTLLPDLGPDIALCPGQTATLFAGDEYVAYLWQDMSTADLLVVSSPGMYAVLVSNSCGT
jgi:hypothetical protein